MSGDSKLWLNPVESGLVNDNADAVANWTPLLQNTNETTQILSKTALKPYTVVYKL
jgi:hypothetical protein